MSVWWPRRSRWEERSIPIFGFTVSPRQAFIFLSSALVGAGVAAALGGVGEIAQLGAFLLLTACGVALASFPVRMVPPELVLLYMIVRWRPPREGGDEDGGEEEGVPRAREVHEEQPTDLYADSDVPLVITGEVPEAPARVRLLVDGREVAAETVGPSSPRYRLAFYPGDAPIGEHELAVELDGDVVRAMRVTVRPRAGGLDVGLLEASGT